MDGLGGPRYPPRPERGKMNKTQNVEIKTEKILVTTEELKALLSCGRMSAIKMGAAAGARVDVGRRVLWNTDKIRKYLAGKTRVII